jgi:amino acid adenylation domain-containing protein
MSTVVHELSAAQRGLWFLDQVTPNIPLYTLAWRFEFEGRLDLPSLRAAFTALAGRHESLRARFEWLDGRPVQVVLPEVEVELAHTDLSEFPAERCGDAATSAWAAEVAVGFDLNKAPLFRARVLTLGDDRHVLVLLVHHIVFDALSVEVLLAELATFYRAAVQLEEATVKPAPQYAAFTAWQRDRLQGDSLRKLLEYWSQRLSGMPGLLTLPTDRPRPAEQTFAGAEYDHKLPAGLSTGLRDLARAQRSTLFMVVLAAFKIVLSRYSGQTDVCVGSAVSGRRRPEFESMIGFFVNTVVLRSDLARARTFREFLQQVRRTCLEAYDHQDLAFDRLVEHLRPDRTLSHNPLFQVTFELHHEADRDPDLPGLRLRSANLIDVGLSKFDLSLTATVSGDEIDLNVEYNADLFDASTIRRLVDHLERVLTQVVGDPDIVLDRVSLLSDGERRRVVEDWNRVEAAELDETLVDLIRAQAMRTADATAVSYEDVSLSYAELEDRSNRMARLLRSRGVSTETRVGICLDRSLDLIVTLLGVVKAGAAFVPLDPEYPTERLAYVVDDAGISNVVTELKWLDRLPTGLDLVLVNADRAVLTKYRAAPIDAGVRRENAAYVIYTSGSTGRPKGAINSHENIVSSIGWVQGLYRLGADDVMLMKTPLGFDDSVREVFWTLSTGGRVVVAVPGGHRDPAYLARVIAKEGVTFLHTVPSLLQAFVDEPSARGRCGSLRYVMSGGEVLTPALQRRFFEMAEADLVNHYGPSEAGVDVTSWVCRRDAGDAPIPIGRPGARTTAYVLDGRGEPVPPGVVGELYIGGPQVGRGYVGVPRLTAERFVPDPFATRPGARLYRTGDFCRWAGDGQLMFAGRADDQVKIRGIRIELGEIEAALVEHPDIRTAALVVREDSPGNRQLVAYLVPRVPRQVPTMRSMRQHLGRSLPSAMVPNVFVVMAALPLNSNEKVDRGALPAPDGQVRDEEMVYVAPGTPTERLIADVWANILELERVGANDDFFMLGGHSLLAVRAISLLREVFQVELPVNAIFEVSTPAALARRLAIAFGDHEAIDEFAEVAREIFSLSDEQVKERLAGDG